MKNQSNTGEQTLVILKPSEALRRFGPIRSQLAKCGLIIEARMVTVTTEAAEVLAAHLRPEQKRATVAHYAGKVLPVMVVEGEDIIHRVSRLVGTESNPELCSEDSIRHQMWQEFGCQVERLNHGPYYNNFISCSRTSGEAVLYIRTLINPNLVSFRF